MIQLKLLRGCRYCYVKKYLQALMMSSNWIQKNSIFSHIKIILIKYFFIQTKPWNQQMLENKPSNIYLLFLPFLNIHIDPYKWSFTIVEDDPKVPFLIAKTKCRGGRYSNPWITPLYPWSVPYNAEWGGIEYHFLSLWYDSTWDWTQVFWAIGEH